MTNRFTRAAALAASVSLALTGALILDAGPSVAATTVPPWQQSGQTDANELGFLNLYNASGVQVSSGSVNDDPIFAYAVGTKTLQAGDTKATLYGVLPKNGQAPGAFTKTQLSGSTIYPAAGAPSSISKTLPVFTGSSSDSTIADLVATTPNNDTSSDGYAGLYELRVKTTAAGQSPSPSYDAVDISVSGNSWKVVYPAVLPASTTKLTASPTTGAVKSPVTLTATISPSTATGTVQFTDGSTKIGSAVAVSSGVAKTTWTPSTVATHSLKASFVPNAASPVGASSGTLSFVASKAKATLTGTWSTTTPTYGTAYTVSATVTAKNLTPTGTVTLLNGSTKLGSATLSAGKAKITVSGTSLAPGTYTEKLSYGGSSLISGASITKKITVVKAKSTSKIRLKPASVTTRTRSKVTITVKAGGVYATGKIRLYDKAKGATLASAKLTSKNKGKIVVSLPVITKAGKYLIHVAYTGSLAVKASTSANAKLTVKKA